MWSTDRIPLISSVAIQKRLPFAISESEVSNFIGNFSLSPDALPVTKRTKYLLHALIKELLIQEKIIEKSTTYKIPEQLSLVCSSVVESCLVIFDSIQLPDYCNIVDNEGNNIATILQIHPLQGQIKGACELDFGTTERQIIHYTAQKLIRIPTPLSPKLKIKLSVLSGTTLIKTGLPIEITPSPVGLVIDTRESDVLLKSSAIRAKQLAVEWLQSFDVQTSDI